MKALILNSGMGRRMGVLTSEQPKCMTEISATETILSRQLRLLSEAGVTEVVITTGYAQETLSAYCHSLRSNLPVSFVYNPLFAETNYIYSIYLAREQLLDADILLLHGDLVFESVVLDEILSCPESCMKVSSTLPLPEKDFKAVVRDGYVERVGVEFFDHAMEAQALYKLNASDWAVWLEEIRRLCEAGERKCYAEKALNAVAERCHIRALDVRDRLCAEIDTPEDLAVVSAKLREIENRIVYACFSADTLHGAHMALIRRAAKLGQLVVGVLSDEAVAGYKRLPLSPFSERKSLFENINGVSRVVEQKTLSYAEILRELRPAFVVHGDDWREGFQRPIRDEAISILAEYGGTLVEYPYDNNPKYAEMERRAFVRLSTPDFRRGQLRRLLSVKGFVTAMEAHSGLTGLIVEKTAVLKDGKARQFDAMWMSSLCDAAVRGKPDIELVDMTSRYRTVDEICDVTTKPIIFDGDTGGLKEHFVYTVRTLERMGVSMVVIEDKRGLKKNSLFGSEAEQTQESVKAFCEKIHAGVEARRTPDFMICARIESLILERGMEDALTRAEAFVKAGADAVMMHSRKKDPSEILEFLRLFRARDSCTPVVLVPTSYNAVYEDELRKAGANIVIYANQMTRAAFPAMRNAARLILEHQRSAECDEICMPIKDIITLIPEE